MEKIKKLVIKILNKQIIFIFITFQEFFFDGNRRINKNPALAYIENIPLLSEAITPYTYYFFLNQNLEKTFKNIITMIFSVFLEESTKKNNKTLHFLLTKHSNDLYFIQNLLDEKLTENFIR